MGVRDRFTRPRVVESLLSWRLAAFVGSTLILRFGLDVGWFGAVAVSGAVYAAVVALDVATVSVPRRTSVDAFAVGEPWRQFVQGAQRASSRLAEIVESTREGPLRDRMASVSGRLDDGLDETYRIACRGHQIDGAIRRLDPTALQSKLESLERRRSEGGGDGLDEAIESVRNQLESTERLREQSAKTASTLRLTQTRLDELVSRASEVSVGAGDTEAYEHDVDDLVIELEGLRLAIEETNRR